MEKKKYHYPEDIRDDYLRKCLMCDYVQRLDVDLAEQPEFWSCPVCGTTNRTFWTPSDERSRPF